jgi:hypothetical protein
VSAPAIGLLVTGGLNVVFTLIWMVLIAIFGVAIMADPDAREALPGVGVWMASGLVGLVASAVTIYAGLQMRKLQGWTLSMAGAVLAMLPCTPCCLLGIPMGIWALLVLIDDEVKRSFDGGGVPPGGFGQAPGGGYDDPPTR